MPGIFLLSGPTIQDHINEFDRLRPLGAHNNKLKIIGEVQLHDWLIGRVITQLNHEDAIFEGSDGISVLFDGYISDFVGMQPENTITGGPAALIAKLYRESGQSCTLGLRGSFVTLIVDHNNETAFLFNDRMGSRPLFFRELSKESIAICPEVSLAASLSPKLTELNQEAVGEFLTRGTFCVDHTLFNDIAKFPQAGKLIIKKHHHEIDNYWKLQFSDSPLNANVNDLVDEYHHLLVQATKRCLKSIRKPILFLSGGLDSRLVLACLLTAGMKEIPAVSWESVDMPGDDAEIAEALATHCRLPFTKYNFSLRDFPETAKQAVSRADGRAFILDCPSLIYLWDKLSNEYDSFFNGDEWRVGWRGNASSIADALDSIGLFCFGDASRISDWFSPQVSKSISKAMKKRQLMIAENTGENNLSNVKDIAFYQERNGNGHNGFTAAKLALLEQARPMLDEDVINFITKLPIEMRVDKLLTKRLLANKYPDLNAIPYSQTDSLPLGNAFSDVLPTNDIFQQFVIFHLTETLHPQLKELLDYPCFTRTLKAMSEGSALPQIRRNWFASLPGIYRFLPQKNRVHPMTGALRLLELNLYGVRTL